MIRSTRPDPGFHGRGIVLKDHALAHHYCTGKGLEIGSAAHNPFNLPDSVNVAPYSEDPNHPDWVDFELYKRCQLDSCGAYDEIDIAAEAHAIPVEPASQDYIISSHVVEHLPNPLQAFKHWNTLLRPGGIVFMIVPLRDAAEIDRLRPVSTVEEVVQAYRMGYTADYFPNLQVETRRRGHYFVYTFERMLEILDWANRNIDLNWRIEATENPDTKVGNGFTIVARTMGPAEPTWSEAPDFGRRETFLRTLKRLYALYPGPACIVETGALRNDTLSGRDGDGWSTVAWGWYCRWTGGQAYTVDINPAALEVCRRMTAAYAPALEPVRADSVEFLRGWSEHETKPIHLLYLDSLDYIDHEASEQHHRAEAEAALPALATPCLVLIDDTWPIPEVDAADAASFTGKGARAIPFFLEHGFRLEWHSGQQVLLSRGSS